jgi:hypothetical protein
VQKLHPDIQACRAAFITNIVRAMFPFPTKRKFLGKVFVDNVTKLARDGEEMMCFRGYDRLWRRQLVENREQLLRASGVVEANVGGEKEGRKGWIYTCETDANNHM